MSKRTLSLILSVAMLLCGLTVMTVFPAAAESVEMTPMHGEPFRPDGVTFGRVSFIVPKGTQGLTKDAWDGNIDHNTDLILLSYIKDGVTYENKTIRQIKEHLGNLALVRTCYTYDDQPDGSLRLNLVFHMDDHSKLKPEDIVAVTVKAGFVWCAGSPAGISGELSSLKLDRDVSFLTRGEAGITGVQIGNMGSEGTSLHVRFDRKDAESLKAISTVNLCPSAIPGKTLGDLVTIGGETVTELVKKGNVARFNFYGNTLIFHVDDPAYLAKIKNEHLEFVILPGFRWMNWDRDDWGNWAGSNKDKYTPVDGTLVTQPIVFYLDENAEVCVKTDGIRVEPGYKDTYFVGDRIDMTTLLIRMDQGGKVGEPMHILESMVTYDFSKVGEATVTVEVKGMKATYTVTVVENPDTEEPTEESTEELTEPVTSPDTEAPTTAPETEPDTEAPTVVPDTVPDTEPDTEPETETEPDTEAPTVEPETDPETDPEALPETESAAETSTGSGTDTTDQGGCGSALSGLWVTVAAMGLVMAAALRKKED